MFPDPEDCPPLFQKRPFNFAVTFFVLRDFCYPIGTIVLGHPKIAFWTTVPEASVDEYCKLRFRKEEVQNSRHGLIANLPSSDSKSDKCPPEL